MANSSKAHLVRARTALLASLGAAVLLSTPVQAASVDDDLPALGAPRIEDAKPRSALARSAFLRQTLPRSFLPGFDRRVFGPFASDTRTRLAESLAGSDALRMQAERPVLAPSAVDGSNNLLRLKF